MNLPEKLPLRALQLLEPEPDAVYTIEATAHLAHVPRRTIALYCMHRLVSPVVDPECGGYYFNDEAIRTLRRIDFFHHNCGVNLIGTRLILELTDEVDRLRAQIRSGNGSDMRAAPPA